uniref:C-C motif chemokine 17 n=1 Tax=Panthera tigris altaica TaxID=74533 RepID=A0A8C9M3K8_PANTA
SWGFSLATCHHPADWGASVGSGQHLGVKKCNVTCSKMTSEIPVALLVHYQRNQESCGKHAIILRTKQNKTFCADPKEKWVQKAMAHLERQTAMPVQNGGTFEKQIGVGEPRTTLAARGMDKSTVTEPKATRESSGQEAQRALGTSPELSTGVADSWGTRFPSTSKAPDGGPPRTELFNAAALTTPASWQSSAYKPGSGLWAEGKASEALPTQAPATQAPPTQVPTILYTASEDQPVWTSGPMPENSLGPVEMGPISAHTDALRGSDSMPRLSMVPVSSESVPSREPVASGSWTPKAEEPIHATVDPQRLEVLITPVPDSQAATRRQAVGLLAFLGLLFCLGVAMFAYQSLQGCPRKMAGDMVDGLRYVPRSCGSNSYVLVPV